MIFIRHYLRYRSYSHGDEKLFKKVKVLGSGYGRMHCDGEKMR